MRRTVAAKPLAVVDVQPETLTCVHCGRSFTRAGNYQKHVCEQRRRWDQRDTPPNRIAYNAWLQFYATTQPGRKQRDYRDFTASMYYTAFVRYGTYCTEIRAVGVPSYTQHLIRERVPIDSWCSDAQYTRFLTGYLRVEDHYDAVRRSLEHMLDISHQQNIELCDVFRYVNPNILCMRITQGHISPWVVYQSDTGCEWLSKLDDDKRALIWEYIMPDQWNIKFRRDETAVEQVKEIIKSVPGL